MAAVEAQRPALTPDMDPATLLASVQQLEQIYQQVYVLSAYGSLWFSADTQSTAATTYMNRMQQTLTGMQNRLLFFDLWWKELDDEAAARLLPDATRYPDYHFFLADMRRTKPFTLDEKSEQIVNLKDADGMNALITLYTMLTSRLEFTLTIDGEVQTLTRDALMANVYSPDPARRADAYRESIESSSRRGQDPGPDLLQPVHDWHNEQVTLRGYKSPIAVRNMANDIPDAAAAALLAVCQRNAGVFQRYFKLKAKWLGMEKLRRYDIYAPLAASDRNGGIRGGRGAGARHLCALPPGSGPPGRRGSSPKITWTARSGRANEAAPSAPPCCRARRPGCCAITPARSAMWPPSPTSWATPCTPCWPSTTASLRNTPRCLWPRQPPSLPDPAHRAAAG